MLRMIVVLFLYGIGGLWGLTNIVRGYALLVWNDIFRPAEWARNYSILNNDTFPSHYYCWGVFGLAATFRPWAKRWHFGATAISGLLVWMWVCRSYSPFPAIAQAEAVKATKYLVPALLVSIALVDRAKQMLILTVLCFSVGIWLAWAGIHAAIIQGDIEITMSIPGGQMTDRNDFLVAATGCLPLLGYFGWYYEGARKKLVRTVVKGMFFASLLAYVMSHSRGAVVGLSALGVFYSFFTGKFLRRFAAVAVIGIALVAVTPQSTWERLETIQLGTHQTEDSAAHRMEHMTTAVKVTMLHPVFGVGPDGFPDASMKYGSFTMDPHSIWLKCSAEYGFVGLAGFVLVLVVLTSKLLRIARRARLEGDEQTEAIATSLCCAYVGFVLTGTFTSQFLSEYLWALIGLSGAFAASEEARYREATASAWTSGTAAEAVPRRAVSSMTR